MTDHVVALFSGAGGLSLGFARAGLAPTFAADVDVAACSTYTKNLSVEARSLDLATTAPSAISDALGPGHQCFAVIGGPPCQGFSSAGSRRIADPRNRLVYRYLEIVDALRPRWFFFENVEGILTSNNGESIRDLIGCFIERGYTVRLEKQNFASYGVPQSRKRVLIVGNRVGLDFTLPAPINSYVSGKHRSVGALPMAPSLDDAIEDLPLSSMQDVFLPYDRAVRTNYGIDMRDSNLRGGVTHHSAAPSIADIGRFRLLKPGQTMKDLPEDLWHPSYRRRAFRRVMDGTPTERRGGAPSGIKRLRGCEGAPTITSAANRELIHPTLDRPLTLREAARAQSFPDWFEFVGTSSMIAKQIGNAVPPRAAERIAAHLAQVDGSIGSATATSVSPGLLAFRLTDAAGQSPALQQTEALLNSLPVSSGTRRKLVATTMEMFSEPA